MTVNRISSLALLNGVLGDVGASQKQLADLQGQISSGLKSTDFKGIDGQVEQYSRLEAKIREAAGYQESNRIGLARLETADIAMEKMVAVANEMANLMIQARSSTTQGSLNVGFQLREKFKIMTGHLNATFNGKYLFGGTNTATAPVPDSTVVPSVEGVPDDTYYAGSGDDITYSADERTTYDFPVRADNEAFQNIFAAINLAISGFEYNNDDDMAAAIDLMQAGQSGINIARADLNTTIIDVRTINDRLNATEIHWKGVKESIVNTDLLEATAKVSNYEAILQATFAVYARLSQLRLTDYLR